MTVTYVPKGIIEGEKLIVNKKTILFPCGILKITSAGGSGKASKIKEKAGDPSKIVFWVHKGRDRM